MLEASLFLLNTAFLSTPLKPFVNQSKVFVVSEVYHVVYHSNIPTNRMAKWLERNTEGKVEGEAL